MYWYPNDSWTQKCWIKWWSSQGRKSQTAYYNKDYEKYHGWYLSRMDWTFNCSWISTAKSVSRLPRWYILENLERACGVRTTMNHWNWILTRFQIFFNRFIPLILIGYEFSDLDVFYNHESYRYLDLGNEFDLGEDSFTVAAMIRLRPDPESSANFTNRGARKRFNFDRKWHWSSRRTRGRGYFWTVRTALKWTGDSWDYENLRLWLMV